MWELDCEESWALKNWHFWPVVLEKTLGLQGDPTSPSSRRSVLGVHCRDWCWSWNSNTLATWCKELTHWKRLWCWERLKAGGEGDDRGWDGWIASPTRWTWVWVNSKSWWRTGRPGVLRFIGSQSQTQLSDWTELSYSFNLRKCKGEALWGFSDHLYKLQHFLVSERKEKMWIKKSLLKCQWFNSLDY